MRGMTNKKKAGVAVLECLQEIPCNPCASSCRAGAITKASLTALPVIDEDKCIGCRMCVAACPGQAIFFLADGEEEDTVEVTFPYEYLPLPEAGDEVTATDRFGQALCPAVVKRVDTVKAYNLTSLVTIEVPAQYRDSARFIKRPDGGRA